MIIHLVNYSKLVLLEVDLIIDEIKRFSCSFIGPIYSLFRCTEKLRLNYYFLLTKGKQEKIKILSKFTKRSSTKFIDGTKILTSLLFYIFPKINFYLIYQKLVLQINFITTQLKREEFHTLDIIQIKIFTRLLISANQNINLFLICFNYYNKNWNLNFFYFSFVLHFVHKTYIKHIYWMWGPVLFVNLLEIEGPNSSWLLQVDGKVLKQMVLRATSTHGMGWI